MVSEDIRAVDQVSVRLPSVDVSSWRGNSKSTYLEANTWLHLTSRPVTTEDIYIDSKRNAHPRSVKTASGRFGRLLFYVILEPMPTNVFRDGTVSSNQSSQRHRQLTNDRVANNTPITTDVVATRVLILGGRSRVVIDVAVLECRESKA